MTARDWKSGDDAGPDPTPDRPALPPHLDPRGARRGVPPRPPRTSPPGRPAAQRVLPSAPPPRRRRAARVLSWVAIVTSVAVLASAAGLYALVNFYDGKINRIAGFDLGGDRPDDVPRDAQNILIVGSDSRGDLEAGEGPQGTGENFVTGERSDTVILAHLYGSSDVAQLISFPRDSWVTIPEHVSTETGELVEARESKLNNALFDGGPPLLVDTIEGLTGLHVDHYMQIDFDGFQRIVNELDGVEVCLPEPAKEKDSGIDLPAGRSTIKGDQALAFVRQRKGLPRGDIDRIARQQQFIGAIVRKVLSAGTLLNPVRVNGVVSIATESLTVDEGLEFEDLQQLAFRFRNFSAGGVVFTTAPVADINGRRQGQDVVLLDEVAGQQLWDALRRDVPPQTAEEEPAGEAPQEPLIVAPGSIRVSVYNGAGVDGLGRRAAADLEALGFQIVGTPEDRGTAETGTVVLHGPDKADSARTLAAAIPGATTSLDPDLGRTLEVVVGSGYDGAQPVEVTGPAPEPEAAASPVPVTAATDPCAA